MWRQQISNIWTILTETEIHHFYNDLTRKHLKRMSDKSILEIDKKRVKNGSGRWSSVSELQPITD